MSDLGRWLVVIGLTIVVVGAALMVAGRLQLPGDLVIRRGGLTVYAPLATSLVISVVLTILLNLFLRSSR